MRVNDNDLEVEITFTGYQDPMTGEILNFHPVIE
jgi:hypothetical protein